MEVVDVADVALKRWVVKLLSLDVSSFEEDDDETARDEKKLLNVVVVEAVIPTSGDEGG